MKEYCLKLDDWLPEALEEYLSTKRIMKQEIISAVDQLFEEMTKRKNTGASCILEFDLGLIVKISLEISLAED